MTKSLMTNQQQKYLSELEAIADRLENGELSESQAKIEGDRVVAEMQRQIVEGVKTSMEVRAKARRRTAMIFTVALLLVLAVLQSYRNFL